MRAHAVVAVATLSLMLGCATTNSDDSASLAEAQKVAWALDANQGEMIVSVSPARQTLQMAGSAGLVVGSSISAVVNDKYRRIVREALTGYDAGAVFEARLAERLDAAMVAELERVSPLGPTAGYNNKREAQKARLKGIGDRTAADLLLDLNMTYGIFGFEGVLVAKLDGRLLTVPRGRAIWEDTVVATTQPVFAGDGLSDPTKQFGPDFGNLRLTVEEGAVEQWTSNQGAELKHRYEQAVDTAIAALLASLDLAHDPLGEFALGVNAMNRKRFEEAEEHFRQALSVDPQFVPALNARAVNLFHNNQIEAAVEMAEQLAAAHPDFPMVWYNLAWFHGVGLGNGAAAKTAYDNARALGMPENTKIEKAIAQP